MTYWLRLAEWTVLIMNVVHFFVNSAFANVLDKNGWLFRVDSTICTTYDIIRPNLT